MGMIGGSRGVVPTKITSNQTTYNIPYLIVRWYVLYQGTKFLGITSTILHCPVEVDLDALPYYIAIHYKDRIIKIEKHTYVCQPAQETRSFPYP